MDLMDYKTILGAVAVGTSLTAFFPYFRDIFGHRTKPHVFSWFVWSILEGTAFFAQVSKGAGPGAWVTAVTAVLCFGVFLGAVSYGEKNITSTDWVSFVGALLGLTLWLFTKNPLLVVILISMTDFLGFVPTFRKSYHKPHEETLKLYALSASKFFISLFALSYVNLTTALYPASLVLTNTAFVIMVLIQRKKYNKRTI